MSNPPEVVAVKVVKIAGRKNLQLRWIDRDGRERQQSAKTTRRRGAERAAIAKSEELLEVHRMAAVGWPAIRSKFESEHVAKTAPRTQSSYLTALNKFENVIDPHDSSDFTSETLVEFVEQCEDENLSPNTIGNYLRHLKMLWRFLFNAEIIVRIPHAKPPKATHSSRGRPITNDEFARMLGAVPSELGSQSAESWRWDLRGLWLSGLRLGEALKLTWDNPLSIQITGIDDQYPMLWIPAGCDKSRRESLTPIAPDWVEILRQVPIEERVGHVFHFRSPRKSVRLSQVDSVSKKIAGIGRTANIIVGRTSNGQNRYASAHDLRRSFGNRWAPEVEAVNLQKLMRHASIATTLRYYVNVEAANVAAKINESYNRTNCQRTIAPEAHAGDVSGDTE